MNYERLTPEQQTAVCKELLAIMRADRLSELASLRRHMLQQYRSPSVWQQIEADRLARQASTFIGGNQAYWQQAAATALGVQTQVDVSIEAVYRVAEDLLRQEPRPEQRPIAARVTLSVGGKKRRRGAR